MLVTTIVTYLFAKQTTAGCNANSRATCFRKFRHCIPPRIWSLHEADFPQRSTNSHGAYPAMIVAKRQAIGHGGSRCISSGNFFVVFCTNGAPGDCLSHAPSYCQIKAADRVFDLHLSCRHRRLRSAAEVPLSGQPANYALAFAWSRSAVDASSRACFFISSTIA